MRGGLGGAESIPRTRGTSLLRTLFILITEMDRLGSRAAADQRAPHFSGFAQALHCFLKIPPRFVQVALQTVAVHGMLRQLTCLSLAPTTAQMTSQLIHEPESTFF